ncbi:peroxiredoxin [Geothrix paludis]|uniref:peroxiredoxin n=1 Tax=Geothrix paludis TaxID=2922722 RepID=UPI001FABF93E|nr:peroxiredoxin [Geothrix paludis]
MTSLIGHPLPAFSLQDDQGATVTAADLKGRWTVLYAYPKDSTPGCTTEACDFRDSWTRVQALGAQVYGLSRDSLKSHQNFITKQSLPFRLLSDPECALLKPLGAFGKKMMYGKEVEGIIRSTFLIDSKGVVRHAWPKVSVKGHVQEVMETLEKLKG